VAKTETITGSGAWFPCVGSARPRKEVRSYALHIEPLETGGEISGAAMTKGLAAVKATLEAEGIEFTNNVGVLGVLLHPKKRGKGK
jgi:hypothetical protein